MAYFLLYRHANLILDDLTIHPYAKDPKYKQQWTEAQKAVSKSLAKLEILKPDITKKHEQHLERRAAREAPSLASVEDSMNNMSIGKMSPRSQSPTRLDPVEHRDMAVSMANREIQRRSGRSSTHDYQDLSTSMISARRQIDRPTSTHAPPRTSSSKSPSQNGYKYPVVPFTTQRESRRSSNEGIPLPSCTSIKHQPTAPQIPPKEQRTSPPPVPVKTTSSPPLPTKSTKHQTHQFTTTLTPESSLPLRQIFLPTPLRRTFLTHASTNTSSNLETLGLLAGTLMHNALFITTLILPPQTATSDTCEMTDEAVLYNYIDSREASSSSPSSLSNSKRSHGETLLILGWIHTHPTQSCFMSSRDLHSHVWYQVSMPESIAVVCSPRDDAWGVFRLTDPPGVGVVKACRKTGVFHPHDDVVGGLYTDCLGRPGHVVEVEGLVFDTVDLRDAE